MTKIVFKFPLILFLIAMCACQSRNRIQYFTDYSQLTKSDSVSYLQPLRIQSGDILQIVISTLNKDISALYNPQSNFAGANSMAQGYMVDRSGHIELPQIGKIDVRDKTTDEINEAIKAELNKDVKDGFVATRLLNFKVSVMGDVARPGTFNVTNERISVLEALSLAGDANVSAKRDEVLLIREREGKKAYMTLNLNDSRVLSSPYYYLSNNDVVYVRPGVNKFISSSAAVQLMPLIISGLTLLVVLYSNVIK